MPTVVERFAAEYFVLNSITDRRRDYSLDTLAKFEVFLGASPETATDNDMRAWMATLMARGLQASTVNWHLQMVRTFHKWAWRQRLLDADSFMRLQDVASPRGARNHTPRPYSSTEIAQMWSELETRFPYATPLMLTRFRNGTSKFRRHIRRHAMRLQLDAIVELALISGLRKNEIYNLSIADVHWDNKYIVAHGKRVDQHDKVREVPYADTTRAAVQAWFRFRGSFAEDAGGPIWLSVTGPDFASPLSPSRMDNILHSFGDWTLHRLRHTCATERLRAGMELELLRDFLGHADIAMTLRYAKLLRGDIHKASERTDAEFQKAVGRRVA